MIQRKRYFDILSVPAGDGLRKAWAETTAAPERSPIPPGIYRLLVVIGEVIQAATGTHGYKLTLEVTEGEYAGRRIWLDLWLTKAAMAMTKRDLAKLGIHELEQLSRPLPPGIIVVARVALRREDNGSERNHVSHFEVVEIRPPAINPFSPDVIDASLAAAAAAAATVGDATDVTTAADVDLAEGEHAGGDPPSPESSVATASPSPAVLAVTDAASGGPSSLSIATALAGDSSSLPDSPVTESPTLSTRQLARKRLEGQDGSPSRP